MTVCFGKKGGGGLTRQPVGPAVGTATMTTVMSANRVDLGSFSSRCCTFRHTHTSADPIRLLCIRLVLTLTLSLPSRLAPSARLTVGVPTRSLWLARIFFRRKKICAGIVGTRTDWVLKGEGGRMMTPPLLQYVARFDGGGLNCWVWRGRLQGELVVVLPVCRIPVSICCSKRRASSFTRVLEGDKPVHHFPRFRPHVSPRAERCS